ncbi:ROK family transcriptional regulator [Paenibacillus sp. UNC499MF]|uniref:ROK family transcriptional regulator n=1 Tax=Paenibacillus sp. UNC499MF TaxID=1502751 RepID=UPI0008A079D1|nr:ROK family transcriptional regulator [Paenibacillus sp. UNC499MF]SEG16928.1 Sugar kinase of the NBD/HSP70 family, may contain an N-terminal HTH domain [Paenibacillus sp. UNC499MF]
MVNRPISERIGNRKQKELFELIRQGGTVSKIELLEESGLTVSTLTRLLDELCTQGLIAESGHGPSTGGRRPVLYRIQANYGCAFGVDISRTLSRLVLTDMQMKVLESRTWEMNETMTPDVLLAALAEEAKAMLKRRRIASEHVLGMGVGAVGPVDREEGVILNPRYFPTPGWQGVPVRRMLEDKLGMPVLLDNGANTALLAESWSRHKRSFRHMLYVHLGVGLRSSMLSEGKIIYGAVDMEGSIGQMIIQTDGVAPRSQEGNYGALESYASIYAVEREIRSKLKQGRPSMLSSFGSPDALAFREIVQALNNRDPLAVEVMTQAAVYFGIGLANLLNMLHPEKVVLGGPLISTNDLFFYTATQTAIKKTYYYPDYQVLFSKGSFGEEALAIGAAGLVIRQLSAH